MRVVHRTTAPHHTPRGLTRTASPTARPARATTRPRCMVQPGTTDSPASLWASALLPPSATLHPSNGLSGSRRFSEQSDGTLPLTPHGSTLACEQPPAPLLVVFSGGTAFNSVAGHLRQFSTRVAHVLPVSDDGGSTAEIVRVLGGPAVGDIRSRCLRLADDSDSEARAVSRLLGHRLSAESPQAARLEWYAIVEGEGVLWAGVSEPYKHVIRAFLLHFHTQILSHTSHRFDYRNGSVGNFFFAGARTFFRSLEAAVFLFSRVARIPEGSLVLPSICTEQRITLGAELADGTVIAGQNYISHPPNPSHNGSNQVDKSGSIPPLPSPIRRVFYISHEGDSQEHEVLPPANPRVLSQLQHADTLVYGMGSLFTSICPSLCLPGIGEAIAARPLVPKVLLLNATHDRETGRSGTRDGPMTATDIVLAVTDALNRRYSRRGQRLQHLPSTYVTALLAPRGGEIEVNEAELAALGVRQVVWVESKRDAMGRRLFEPTALVQVLAGLVPPPVAAATLAPQHSTGVPFAHAGPGPVLKTSNSV